MRKWVLLFLAASCLVGCKHVGPLAVKEPPAASYSIPAPPTPIPPGSVPPWVAQRREEPAAEPVAPASVAAARGFEAVSQARPLERVAGGVAKANDAGKTKPPTGESKPSEAPAKQAKDLAAKDAAAKDAQERKSPAVEPARTAAPALPGGFWYAIIGTLFTCILAPIVVELIKERMKSDRADALAAEASGVSCRARPCRSKR